MEARRELLAAAPWLHVWAEDVRLPDGRIVEGYLRLEMLDYVVVVALSDAGVIVLRSYKHGPADVVTSLPAGYLEPNEEPAAAARRELLEERATSPRSGRSWALSSSTATGGPEPCTSSWLEEPE